MTATHADALDLARAIAEHLPGFTAEPNPHSEQAPHWSAQLVPATDGPTIFLRTASGRAAFDCTGWPTDCTGRTFWPHEWPTSDEVGDEPTCTADPTRDPAAIARQLQRTLIPWARKAWDACAKRAAESTDYHTARASMAQALGDALGCSVQPPAYRGNDTAPEGTAHFECGSVDVEAMEGGAIFRVRIGTPEQAVAVAKALRTTLED